MGTRWLVPALCAASVVLFSACSDSSSPSGGGGNPPPDGDVLVRNDFYQPATLQVTTGTTVTWAWDSDGQAHTVTFNDGSVNSGTKTSGTFQHTFDAAGTYPYHCQIHGQIMSGTITVTEAAGGAAAPPAGGGSTGGGSTGGGSMGGGGYTGY